MLPGADGFAITRALREAQRYTPILMLTARARSEDILEGLEAGADDYLPKPFDLNILIVRIKSLLRRTAWQAAARPPTPTEPPPPTDTYFFNNRTIDFAALELIAPNRITNLTVMEADLLRFFTEREGQIVSRTDILEQVWRVHADTDTRAIDNFIVRLRPTLRTTPPTLSTSPLSAASATASSPTPDIVARRSISFHHRRQTRGTPAYESLHKHLHHPRPHYPCSCFHRQHTGPGELPDPPRRRRSPHRRQPRR